MSLPYDPNHPKSVYELPSRLREVSGIHVLDRETLACVEDEHLNIHLFSLPAGHVSEKLGVDTPRDAEDIVVIGRTAYVLCATRRVVYVYQDFRHTMEDPEAIGLDLERRHDPEGMCLGSGAYGNCLLIACKGDPDPGTTARAVFALDLGDRALRDSPVSHVDARMLGSSKRRKTFNPSGIAVHPVSGEIYLIGSKSLKRIVRLDSRGERVLGERKLRRSIYPQPEGIAFAEDGTLFIASEGKGNDPARIVELAAD